MREELKKSMLDPGAGPWKVEIPSWAFGHSATRVGKLLQPYASSSAMSHQKWRGTQHGYFFRMNISGG
jgi:hypothetical protein